MSKLKPCPFCGSDPVLTTIGNPWYWVSCLECKITTKSYNSKSQAIKAWNTRLNEGEWQAIATSLKLECIRLSKENQDV